jgi:hypothetical protein
VRTTVDDTSEADRTSIGAALLPGLAELVLCCGVLIMDGREDGATPRGR